MTDDQCVMEMVGVFTYGVVWLNDEDGDWEGTTGREEGSKGEDLETRMPSTYTALCVEKLSEIFGVLDLVHKAQELRGGEI